MTSPAPGAELPRQSVIRIGSWLAVRVMAAGFVVFSLIGCMYDDIDRLFQEAQEFESRGPGNSNIDPEIRLRDYPEYLRREDFRGPYVPLFLREQIEQREMEKGLVALLRRKCAEDTYACVIRELQRLDFSCDAGTARATCSSTRTTRNPADASIKDPYIRQGWTVIVERRDEGAEITRMHEYCPISSIGGLE